VIESTPKQPVRTGGARLMLAVLVLTAGCGKEEIRVYRVPKETPVLVRREAVKPPAAAMPKLDWKLPPGWEDRGPGQMGIASFWISGAEGQEAEVSVMPMRGESAGNLNLLVNIVREREGMEPITDQELARLVEDVRIGEATAKLVDLSGAALAGGEDQQNRIVLAVLTRAGTTWFFKMAGSAELVSLQKRAFLDFLKSITFRETHGPSIAAEQANSPGATQTKPEWEVPHNWQEVPATQLTQLVLAKFQIGGQEGTAEITVSVLSGSGGRLPANVNRWRGQIGLAPVTPDEAERLASPLDVLGGKAMLVDMSGDNRGQKTRLICVLVPREGQTWFYKLMGEEAVAEREKAAFLKFVQTARYPNA
jgi:hypothetical protein